MGTCGHSGIGEGTWIPAFAGKTGGAIGEAIWVRAFAGKTGGAIGEAIWVRAFAGKTGVVAVAMATCGYTDIGRGRGFRLSS